MDRQLESPLIIETLSQPDKLSSKATFAHLQNFLFSLPVSPARTQLERLTDALGVEVGAIEPLEGERREAEREAKRAKVREDRRRKRRELEELQDQEELEGVLEGLEDDEKDADMNNGAVGQEGEEGMDDRGDIGWMKILVSAYNTKRYPYDARHIIYFI
ncbi:uncharacterized protein L203_105737 [Cryptococcus depauperatus CBS 7841]|uniref:Uncharacterized protein n=1 Tax=Cryptococcus depauperatus CBS 7841 TaxID=1295531 RepID=A0AAJ8JXQ4_9TREE